MMLVTNQQPIVAFPADVWEKAKSKEELEKWLNKYAQETEISPILKMKDYLTIGKREILIEIQVYANEEILALLPNTDIAADGKTIDEAKHNLLLDISDDYDYLVSRREVLGEELSAQLHLLEEILKEQIYLTKEEFEFARRGQLSEKEYLEILKKK